MELCTRKHVRSVQKMIFMSHCKDRGLCLPRPMEDEQGCSMLHITVKLEPVEMETQTKKHQGEDGKSSVLHSSKAGLAFCLDLLTNFRKFGRL